jgi:hypothetical protein
MQIAKENQNLLVSLRGGLNNFGIVTSFTMNTIPVGNIWGGINYYMPGSFAQLIQATVAFVQNETDLDTHIISSTGYGMGQQVVTCCMYHTKGRETHHRSSHSHLSRIKSKTTVLCGQQLTSSFATSSQTTPKTT